MNRVRRFLFLVLLPLALPMGHSSPSFAEAAESPVTKEVCLTTFGMTWRTSEEAKAHLLTLAKREAAGELFGEFIKSVTEIKDFQLKRDEILSMSSGLVRIQGAPEYFNGKGYGEICVRVIAYTTAEDRLRFRPREVRKKVCIADPRMSLGETRQTAEKQARIQAVKDFEPRLEYQPDDVVLGLLHESKTHDSGFIPDTTTYCATVTGVVYPIELLAVTESGNVEKAGATPAVEPPPESVQTPPNKPISIEGVWTSKGSGAVYNIKQKGKKFEWNVESYYEKASGHFVDERNIWVSYNGVNGRGTAKGSLTNFGPSGQPNIILWDNGGVFIRVKPIK